MLRSCVFSSALLLLATRVWSSDGVIEINQASALAGGVTSGDAPGFPVTISTLGSYRLTSNLSVPINTSGIVVSSTVASVALDLGGFEIRGAGSCSETVDGVTCTGGGGTTGNGIAAGGGIIETKVQVRNGRVRGFGAEGVHLQGGGHQVEGLIVEQNAADGIRVGSQSRLSGSTAMLNLGNGFYSGGRSVVERCISSTNRLAGFLGNTANVFIGNTAYDNEQFGITAGDGAIVRDNNVSSNTADGIVVNRGSLVVGNVCTSNRQAGIAALSSSSVQNNVVQGNTGVGLYLFPEGGGTAAAYSGNTVIGNGGSVVNGINMGGNSCNGTATCP